MSKRAIVLGETGKDVITGFQGVVIAKCEYLTGCNQYLLQPQGDDDHSKRPQSEWFDTGRIRKVKGGAVVAASDVQDSTPGFERAAPKR